MKATEIKAALITNIKAEVASFIWGPPGVGKSDVVKQTAKELGVGLIDVRAVLLDPVDLRGLPHLNGDGHAHWATPEFLPREGKGILFLDELNAAPPLVQAACYQLVLDGKLGEYVLPKGWHIIAAGNRDTDRAVTHRMPSPLANRFIHLDFDVDTDEWVHWAMDHDVMTEAIAFVRFRPELLHKFDPTLNEKAFPTPRSWEFVSKILKVGPVPSIELQLLTGTVGAGAASEFIGFLRIFRDLPDPKVVIMHPETADIPEDPATLYALCGALARKASIKNIDKLVKYYNRLPSEFSVLAMRDSVAADKSGKIVETRSFVEWASAHSDVII